MKGQGARVFTIRRPQLEQPLPEHGLLYFDHLHAEFRSRPCQDVREEQRTVIKDILGKRQTNCLTWNDLYTFDLILSRHLPTDRLSREVWNLRSRYRDVAGLRVYEAYLASKPPNLEGQVVEADLRADIEYLLGEVYLRYTLTPVNEKLRDRITKRVTSVILVGIVVMLMVVGLNAAGNALNATDPTNNAPGFISKATAFRATLLLVLFIGAMGGLLSMQQRYQSVLREGDPLDNISELMQGWSRLFLPALSGALFASLLYIIIIAGLLTGDLFPNLIGTDPSPQGVGLFNFLSQVRPASNSDYAKLIVWSFIAGFAERFVPDTLSRFVSRREVNGGTSS